MRIWLILLFLVCLPQYIFANQQFCPFKASSVSAFLIDAETGKILYSQNPNFRIQPASLTKVMTLFLIFDALDQKLSHAIISDLKNILKTIPLYANEEIQQADFKKIILQTFEYIISKHKVSLVMVIFIISIFGLQALRIRRLQKQIKQINYHRADIVKGRLNKIVKTNK